MNSTGPSQVENVLAAGGMFVLSCTGLGMYILVLYTLYKYRNHFSNSFYRYISFLGGCDCLMLILFLIYAVPLTIFQANPFGESYERLMGFLCNLGFYATLPTTVSIALNRYWAVCRNETLHDVFTGRNVKINMVFNGIFGLIFGAIPTLFKCCPLNYYYSYYSWSYDVSLLDGFLGDYMLLEQIWTLIVCLSLCTSYIFILLEMRKTQKTVVASINDVEVAERKKLEAKLALQFLGVGIYMLIFDVAFNVLPSLSDYHWHLYITSVLYIGNCSINPYIYLATNSQLREKIVTVFKKTQLGSQVPTAVRQAWGTSGGRIVAKGPRTNDKAREVTTRSQRKLEEDRIEEIRNED